MQRNSTLERIGGVIVVGLLLASCAPSGGKRAAPTLASTATLSDALRRDAEAMAEQLGIPVEEAMRRASLQDLVGDLNATLEQREAATYSGLWIQDEPEYRIVVAFTRDGEKTLRPYVENTPLAGLVKVQMVGASLAELEADERQVAALVRELGFPFSSAVDVIENRVVLWVTDRAQFEAALQNADRHLPEEVELVVVHQQSVQAPAGIIPAPDVAFPQLRTPGATRMTSLLQGKLLLRDGCLRVGDGEGVGYLVIWQTDYFLNDRLGTLEIWDRDGQVVARAGEEIRLGGGEVRMTPDLEAQLFDPVPLRCREPYWLMGEIVHK